MCPAHSQAAGLRPGSGSRTHLGWAAPQLSSFCATLTLLFRSAEQGRSESTWATRGPDTPGVTFPWPEPRPLEAQAAARSTTPRNRDAHNEADGPQGHVCARGGRGGGGQKWKNPSAPPLSVCERRLGLQAASRRVMHFGTSADIWAKDARRNFRVRFGWEMWTNQTAENCQRVSRMTEKLRVTRRAGPSLVTHSHHVPLSSSPSHWPAFFVARLTGGGCRSSRPGRAFKRRQILSPSPMEISFRDTERARRVPSIDTGGAEDRVPSFRGPVRAGILSEGRFAPLRAWTRCSPPIKAAPLMAFTRTLAR